MKQELVDRIINKCPNLFSELKEIYAPDGWFNVIHSVSIIIEHELKALPPELQGQIHAVQIKSKFGGLRFYMNKSTPYINGAIALAETLSYTACEDCGAPDAKGRNVGYSMTLCDLHFEERAKDALNE